MSHWNYRIVHRKTQGDHQHDWYELCEVYYDDDGTPYGRTDALSFEGETPEELIADLELALQSAKSRPVLVCPFAGGDE